MIRIQTDGRRTEKKMLYNWKFLPQYEEKIRASSFFFHLPVKLGEFNNITRYTHTHMTCTFATMTGMLSKRHVIILRRATGFTRTEFLRGRSSLKLLPSFVVRDQTTIIMCLYTCIQLYWEPTLHHVVHAEFINLRYPSLDRAPRSSGIVRLCCQRFINREGEKVNFPINCCRSSTSSFCLSDTIERGCYYWIVLNDFLCTHEYLERCNGWSYKNV